MLRAGPNHGHLWAPRRFQRVAPSRHDFPSLFRPARGAPVWMPSRKWSTSCGWCSAISAIAGTPGARVVLRIRSESSPADADGRGVEPCAVQLRRCIEPAGSAPAGRRRRSESAADDEPIPSGDDDRLDALATPGRVEGDSEVGGPSRPRPGPETRRPRGGRNPSGQCPGAAHGEGLQREPCWSSIHRKSAD